VIELHPALGSPGSPDSRFRSENRSTLCDNERQLSKPRLEKPALGTLAVLTLVVTPVWEKWVPITGLRPALWSTALVLEF
jgi:hypothetical protein